MFCTNCGSELVENAKFCGNCGHAVSARTAEAQTFQTEAAFTARTSPASSRAAANSTPPLWNPNAAASWSLIFTPAFGAYLQMRNWRALGEQDRALVSQRWFAVSMVMLAFYVALGMVATFNKGAEGFMQLSGLVFLLVWYFSNGNKQAPYVKQRFANDYPRRSWLLPITAAMAGFVVYLVLAGIVAAAIVEVVKP